MLHRSALVPPDRACLPLLPLARPRSPDKTAVCGLQPYPRKRRDCSEVVRQLVRAPRRRAPPIRRATRCAAARKYSRRVTVDPLRCDASKRGVDRRLACSVGVTQLQVPGRAAAVQGQKPVRGPPHNSDACSSSDLGPQYVSPIECPSPGGAGGGRTATSASAARRLMPVLRRAEPRSAEWSFSRKVTPTPRRPPISASEAAGSRDGT